MAPQLALAICTGFVLWLLRLDRKQAPTVSWVLWLPTLWMLYVSSKPLDFWFSPGVEGGDTDSGSPLDRNFLIGLLVVSLVILVRRRVSWVAAMRQNPWIWVLLGYMLLSVCWSEIPFISLKRWVRQFQALVIGLLILSEASPKEALQSVFRRTIYILVPFSIMLIKYYPDYGVMYGRWTGELMWVGVTCQKNGLGRLCFLGIFFLVWLLARKWRDGQLFSDKKQTGADVFVLALSCMLMRGPDNSYSATAIAALGLGLGVLGWLVYLHRRGRFPKPFTLAVGVAGLVILGTMTPFVGGSTVGSMSNVLGRDATLTGRTDIWNGLIPIALEHSVLGAGFGGFWTESTIQVHKVNECHSGYLEVLLESGAAGLLLHALFLIACCRKAGSALSVDFDWAGLCLGYVFMSALYNLSESSMNIFASQITATVIFAVLVLPYPAAAPEPAAQFFDSTSPELSGMSTVIEAPAGEHR